MGAARTTRSVWAAGCTAAFVLVVAADAAAQLEIRHTLNALYDAELTRAYQQCGTPNAMASNGIPACSPPVTSACDFGNGRIEMASFRDSPSIRVEVVLRNVDGPGNCTTGTYTAYFELRVTVDDPICTSGQCTWDIFAVPVQLAPTIIGDNYEVDVDFESFLLSEYGVVAGHVANYEVLGIMIYAPDNLPIAAAGVGNDHGANNFRSEVTTRYAACTSVDTSTQSGIPACSAPTWNASCDFAFGQITIRSNNTTPPEVSGQFSDVVGASPLCADGSYAIGTVVRATGPVCGGMPCTLVDTLTTLPVSALDGVIDGGNTLDTVGFTGTFDSVEIRETFLTDPLGEEIASVGVTNALPFDTPRVRIAFRDLALSNDDKLTLRAKMRGPSKMPYPPIDPTVDGATFTVTDQNGTIYSATIPAAAWEVLKPGAKWQYKDKFGTLAGVRKASIKLSGNPSAYRLKLVAQNLDLSAADLPSVNLVVSVSNTGSGTTIGMRNAACTVKPKGKNCRL